MKHVRPAGAKRPLRQGHVSLGAAAVLERDLARLSSRGPAKPHEGLPERIVEPLALI